MPTFETDQAQTVETREKIEAFLEAKRSAALDPARLRGERQAKESSAILRIESMRRFAIFLLMAALGIAQTHEPFQSQSPPA